MAALVSASNKDPKMDGKDGNTDELYEQKSSPAQGTDC